MPRNRRRFERHAVGFYVDQLIDDEPMRCFATDLSALGLYMQRPVQAINRSSKLVQLEIALPRGGDSIWALGEVVYDRLDSVFHGTAVCFQSMAHAHRRWLCEWLHETTRNDRFPTRRPPKVFINRPGLRAVS